MPESPEQEILGLEETTFLGQPGFCLVIGALETLEEQPPVPERPLADAPVLMLGYAGK
jgi:hypothetical protein